MTFDKEWFRRYQKILLWLCNSSLTKYLFRRLLWIDEKRADIIELSSDSYKWRVGRYVKADIRMGNVFAVGCYRAFKPLWYILHAWDWLSSPVPAWNLGFDTLTSYTGATTNDCVIQNDSLSAPLSFATLIAGGGSRLVVDQAQAIYTTPHLTASSAPNPNEFILMSRGILTFNTTLPAGSLLTAAVLSLRGTARTSGLGTPDIHVVKAFPASDSSFVGNDYKAVQNISFGSVLSVNWGVSGYNDFMLNTDGLMSIDITGNSRFATRLSWDVNGSFGGSWVANATSSYGYRGWNSAFGQGQAPKLVLTYLPGITGTLSITLGDTTLSASNASIGWGDVPMKVIEDWARVRTDTVNDDNITDAMMRDWCNWATQKIVGKFGRDLFYIGSSPLGPGTSFDISSISMRGIEKLVDSTNGEITFKSPTEFERLSNFATDFRRSMFYTQEGETIRVFYGTGLTPGTIMLYYYRYPRLITGRESNVDIRPAWLADVTEIVCDRINTYKSAILNTD